MLNDPKENEAVNAKLDELRSKAAQQPISYKWLFDQAIELAAEQFMRAMRAEAALWHASGKDSDGDSSCARAQEKT